MPAHKTTKSYCVQWEINVDADSFEDAARRALRIQRYKKSTATVFNVSCDMGYMTGSKVIDLAEKGDKQDAKVEGNYPQIFMRHP